VSAPAPSGAVSLSVVVPVRNEAGNVLPLLEEIHAALLSGPEFEVIYVDDGSRDATPAELLEARARFPRLRVLTHRESCGQSAALLTGVRAARAEWVVTLDGDGQNDPADIARLLAARDRAGPEANVQLVTGWRVARRDRWAKRAASRVANAVRAWLLADGTPDTGCGLKLVLRSAYLELPAFDHMHRFLPALIQRNGGATLSVPVAHRPRAHGRSSYGVLDRLWVGIVDTLGVMWLQRRTRRPVIVEADRA
jgi:dolichol-phosphate mannosyltransferase